MLPLVCSRSTGYVCGGLDWRMRGEWGEDRKPGNDEGMGVGKREGEREEEGRTERQGGGWEKKRKSS